MKRNELIANVALDYVVGQLQAEAEGTLRFCMVGLDPAIMAQTALAVLNDPATSSSVLVRLPSAFAAGSAVPSNAISDESITHWRHRRLEEGKRAVLFAASHEELQRNDKSVEKITRIETDRLRELYQSWATRGGLTSQQLDSKRQEHLAAALQSANETHVARTIEMFADYVLAIATAVRTNGLPLQKALDHGLPALKLPRNSGYFDRIAEKARGDRQEWIKAFRRLHTKIRPMLVRENEKGEDITDQLRGNYAELKERLDDRQKAAIEAFLEDDLTPDGWTTAQDGLVHLDWRVISELFDGIERTKAQPLGEKTIEFFADEYDNQLEETERDLLNGGLPKTPTESVEAFFDQRREMLSKDKKIYGQWERYIYRNPQTFSDFLVGLLDTIQRIRERTNDADLKTRNLAVRIVRRQGFWDNGRRELTEALAHQGCHFRLPLLDEASGAV